MIAAGCDQKKYRECQWTAYQYCTKGRYAGVILAIKRGHTHRNGGGVFVRVMPGLLGKE